MSVLDFKNFTQDYMLQNYFQTKEVEIKSEPCINWYEKTSNKYYKSESDRYIDKGLLNVFSINLQQSNKDEDGSIFHSKFKPGEELIK